MKVKFTEEYKIWCVDRAKLVTQGQIPFDLDGTYEVIKAKEGGMLVKVDPKVGILQLSILNESLIIV